MSSTLNEGDATSRSTGRCTSEPFVRADFWPWALLGGGLLVLFVPTVLDLSRTLWRQDAYVHGPIVLAVAAWLLWRKRAVIVAGRPDDRPIGFGWLVLLTGLMLYTLGRSQAIMLFELGSLTWVLAGVFLLMRGPRTLAAAWFPLFFLLFALPLPGTLVDALTGPMKIAVSWVAEHLLYAFGYPIARTGVILQVGPYQLLVADACAGLHTLFMLEAMGLLYLNLVHHDSWMRNVTLAILIVPISFLANVIRVIVLTLITFHLGDEAGQGFLHGFAGMVLFLAGLLLIIGADSMLRFGARMRVHAAA